MGYDACRFCETVDRGASFCIALGETLDSLCCRILRSESCGYISWTEAGGALICRLFGQPRAAVRRPDLCAALLEKAYGLRTAFVGLLYRFGSDRLSDDWRVLRKSHVGDIRSVFGRPVPFERSCASCVGLVRDGYGGRSTVGLSYGFLRCFRELIEPQ